MGRSGPLSFLAPGSILPCTEFRVSTACLARCDEGLHLHYKKSPLGKVLASDSGELGPWPRSNQLYGEVTPLVFHVIIWKILIPVNSSA